MMSNRKDYYADVIVVMKVRERISFTAEGKPTKEQMLDILLNKKDDVHEVTDSESLEYISVESVDVIEEVDAEK